MTVGEKSEGVSRVAFRFIGSDIWQGGYNYLLNLCAAITANAQSSLQPVVFYGDSVGESDLKPFKDLLGENCIYSAVMTPSALKRRALTALVTGRDNTSAEVFLKAGIDVVFENADFFGRNFPLPIVSWIPDFQHRQLRHLFSTSQYIRREIGFRAQIASDRLIMVSSEASRQDCLGFYKIKAVRVRVVSFAIPFVATESTSMDVRKEYDLPSAFFFLPNTFWPHKNHKIVVDALAYARLLGVEVVVAVSGKGNHPSCIDAYEEVQAEVKKQGLESNFRMLGRIPYDHVRALLASCQALINPSRFEGWSTTIEEAKSYGVNLILSDLAVNKEQVGDEGHFFDVEDYKTLAQYLIGEQTRQQERCKDVEELARQSEERMAEFGDTFSRLVLEVKGAVNRAV